MPSASEEYLERIWIIIKDLQTKVGNVGGMRIQYLGGQRLLLNGAAMLATIPAGTDIVEIRAETADVFFEIDGATANANSSGYVATGGVEVIGVISNLWRISLYAAANGIAHLIYFKSVP